MEKCQEIARFNHIIEMEGRSARSAPVRSLGIWLSVSVVASGGGPGEDLNPLGKAVAWREWRVGIGEWRVASGEWKREQVPGL